MKTQNGFLLIVLSLACLQANVNIYDITDLIAWTVGWKPGTSDSVMKPSVGLCECGEVGEEAGVERGTGGQRDVGMSFPAVIFSRVSSLKVGVMVEGPPGCM